MYGDYILPTQTFQGMKSRLEDDIFYPDTEPDLNNASECDVQGATFQLFCYLLDPQCDPAQSAK